MKVAFRTDASLQIGSGHVMRCLALAEALAAQGAECHFISRAHPGNLVDFIRKRGFIATTLPATPAKWERLVLDANDPVHASWLCCDRQTDARQTLAVLADLQPDWLIVDHYALDHRWEVEMRGYCGKLLIIDDLADRSHNCDLLLDQNLGRTPEQYVGKVPAQSSVLVGAQYALLRPEFAALRARSLQRRQQERVVHLLITMGGVDLHNATGQVLRSLDRCPLDTDCRISVVMGMQAPWLRSVQEQAANMQWPTEVLVNIVDMADRMALSDLAIGAAGCTSWERCCLGLPTLLVVLADNQWSGARALNDVHAAILIGGVGDIDAQLPIAFHEVTRHHRLRQLSDAASSVTDGLGVGKVLHAMGFEND